MSTRFFVPLAVMLLAVCPPAAHGEENAAPRPVSVQELSLLLRSGYTGDEVLKETAGRPLLAPIDAAAERALLEAGADARTVAALRDSRRVASTPEADDARQRQDTAKQYKLDAWAADQSRRLEVNRAAAQAKLAERRDEQLKHVATSLRDKLVVYRNDRLEPYDNAALAGKKVFLLYATSIVDKAGRQLTPQLVEFYKKFAPVHPEFELVLLSGDRSAFDMEKLLQQQAIPWPALAWERLPQEASLADLLKDGVPRLLLVDGSGSRIADNLENGKLVNPQHVLDVLSGKSSPGVPATAAR